MASSDELRSHIKQKAEELQRRLEEEAAEKQRALEDERRRTHEQTLFRQRAELIAQRVQNEIGADLAAFGRLSWRGLPNGVFRILLSPTIPQVTVSERDELSLKWAPNVTIASYALGRDERVPNLADGALDDEEIAAVIRTYCVQMIDRFMK